MKETAMKRRVSGAALVALALATITGCSVHVDDGDSVSREFGSDYFGVGGMLTLTDSIRGDALLAGGSVSTAGEIDGDLVAAAGELSIGGAIGDDLYAAGGNVQFDAIVQGNARVAGGDVNVGPATVVVGGLSLAGARVEFNGNAHEYLHASGGSVRINGIVQGDAEVRAEELVVGPEARIGGRLLYRGSGEPEVAAGALISGGLEAMPDDEVHRFDELRPRAHDAVHGFGRLLWFAGVFAAGALYLLLVPRFASEAAATVGRKPLPSLGLGLAIALCVPFVAAVLLITIIGIPLALLLVALYLVVLFLGWMTTALYLGQRGLAVLRAGQPTTRGWQIVALLLALVALWLVRQVPVIGGLVGLVALLVGIGALTWRTWNGRREATA